ncbi:hypothetical protein INR49_006637 [Caranx melampygus]|nr:hypothetical protein INR49_006637 [Caranx melampygus]
MSWLCPNKTRERQRNLDFNDMEFVKILLYLVICQSSGIITAADDHLGHSAENVHWVSLDFKTIITWTSKGSDQTFSVQFAEVDDEIWRESLDCTQVSYTQCDLSNDLRASDRWEHTSAVQLCNISAATFTVEALDDGRVRVNITDPLTALHNKERQLNIRDVFKKDLKYKIGYYKSGNTRKASTAGETSSLTPVWLRYQTWMPERVTASWWQHTSPPDPETTSWSLEQRAPVYRRVQTPIARAESRSMGRYSLHPAYSPHHHHHCDSPLLQVLPHKGKLSTRLRHRHLFRDRKRLRECVCLSNTGSWPPFYLHYFTCLCFILFYYIILIYLKTCRL